MGGLSDLLFGSKAKLQTQTLPTLSPEQDAMLKNLLATFGAQGGGNYNAPGFEGGMTAGVTGREMTSLAALEQEALSNVERNAELTGATDNALLDILKGGGNATNFEDFFSTNVRDPAIKDFGENIRPAIDRSFGGSSFFSSDRAQADNQASEELIRSITGNRASLAFQTQESASDRLMQAIGLSTQRDVAATDAKNSRVSNLATALDRFGVEREVEQGGKDREYAEFVRQAGAKDQRIAQILAALGIQTKENLGVGLPGSTGLVQAFLGAVGSGAGAALGGKIGG